MINIELLIEKFSKAGLQRLSKQLFSYGDQYEFVNICYEQEDILFFVLYSHKYEKYFTYTTIGGYLNVELYPLENLVKALPINMRENLYYPK